MNKARGFTLIELMVVIAIVAILTTLAAPSFVNLIQSNSMASAVNTFMADMRFARSESIRRGGGVVLCRSDNPEASPPACSTTSSSNGWVSGWIVYIDQNNNGSIDDGEVLRVQGPITSIDSIVQPTTKNKFPFTATGRFQNLTGGTSTFQFGGSAFPNENQRVLCVSIGGQVRIAGNGLAGCS
jgi:type IV fimbrial biogenesis protein FimT